MEHWRLSTQAVLYCDLHRVKALKTDMAKTSAALCVDLLVDKALKSDNLCMIVSDDCPVGAVPTSGLRICYAGVVVHDAWDLLDNFPLVGKALGRKDDRNAVLGD